MTIAKDIQNYYTTQLEHGVSELEATVATHDFFADVSKLTIDVAIQTVEIQRKKYNLAVPPNAASYYNEI